MTKCKLAKYLIELDLFGVPIQLTHHSSQQYKTLLGAISTLLIISASLAYSLYILIRWQTGEMLPKIQNSYQILDPGTQVTLQPQFITISETTALQDPFTEVNNIITPIFVQYKNGYMHKENMYSQNGNIILENFDLQVSADDIFKPDDYNQSGILFVRCDRSIFTNCASDQAIESFFDSNQSTLQIDLQLTYFDPKIETNYVVKKTQFIIIQETQSFVSILNFKTQFQQLDKGILFQSIKSNMLIQEYDFSLQTIQNTFLFKQFNETNAFGFICFRLDQVQELQMIIYPKLSEILAQIGSIFQLLLLAGIVVKLLNFHILLADMNFCFMSRYVEQIKKISIQKKYIIFGQQTAYFDDQQINIEEFNKFKKQCQSLLLGYMNYVDLIVKIQNLSVQMDYLIKHLNIDEKQISQIKIPDFIQKLDLEALQELNSNQEQLEILKQ